MACEGCTCGRAEAEQNGTGAAAGGRVQSGGLAGDEQLRFAENVNANGNGDDRNNLYNLRSSRSFTAPQDWVEPAEGIEPAVPLRSKKWFNEPGDDMVGCYVERYLNGGLTCESGRDLMILLRDLMSTLPGGHSSLSCHSSLHVSGFSGRSRGTSSP